tara:strand:+ start:358 stop:669 length:312 start_codon:yes stop_codon:yes gene_type:complete
MHSYAHWKETNPDGTVADYYRAIGMDRTEHGFFARDYVGGREDPLTGIKRTDEEELRRLHAMRMLGIEPPNTFGNVPQFPIMKPPHIPSIMNLLGVNYGINIR